MKRIAVITGASSGMGREFALQIAALRKGEELWLVARRAERLHSLAAEIASQSGCVARPVPLDISGKSGVMAFRDLLLQEERLCAQNHKRLVVSTLVNNAGFGTYGPFEQTPVEREIEMTELNCTSVVGLCGVCLPFMQSGSIIINTASLASFLPLGNFAVYGATKAYVLSFSQALAAEVRDKGVKVCALCPGPVSTEFANVASNGARPAVKHGLDAAKVVAHCLRSARKGKKTAVMAFKWKFKAFASRFIGRYIGARFTYKFCKRPCNHDVPN